MELYDVIGQRHSQRSYAKKPIDRQILTRIVDCARLAPSGVNRQEWKFVVVDDPALKARVADAADYGKFIADAGACIAVFYGDNAVCPVEDCAAATQNMILAATAEGLGTCWVGSHKSPHSAAVKELLGAPQGWELAVLLAVGYVDEPAQPRQKKTLDDVLSWNGFA
ncbi:MAG: nitroreductase family protein [Eubacteriales bacterium]|nr:nitroreductase family protein [Eubacteriales bacterium]